MIATYPTTHRLSYSFYVDSSSPDTVRRCANIADAVVLRGSDGPRTVKALRSTGWNGTVLFDGAAYERRPEAFDPHAWMSAQEEAGADRFMSPGKWIPWPKTKTTFEALITSEVETAQANNATAVLALDYRWITRGIGEVLTSFRQLSCPVALVLAHKDDPLSVGEAVPGLTHLSKATKHLTLMRSDHGAIGALAFDATHASIGLRTATRHLYPPDQSGGGGKRDDRSPRVFVSDLLDWYTGMTLAGWYTLDISPVCNLDCCDGQPLNRFFDDRLSDAAQRHNERALAAIASYVINAPRHDRRRLFAELCKSAVDRYDRLGPFGRKPKGQLEAWAIWA